MSVRPRLRASSASFRPLTRLGVLTSIALLVLGSLYAIARETSLFAIHEITVSGAQPTVRKAVRQAVQPLLGESLVALDRGELAAQLEALPTVRSVSIDRAFPNTLTIHLREERLLAVVRSADTAWLVSPRGRLIREIEPGALRRLPRIWLPSHDLPAVGKLLATRRARLAVQLLEQAERLSLRASAARVRDGELAVILSSGAQLRLGDARQLRRKFTVIGRVLAALTGAERASLRYLDVGLPERPVAAFNSQVEG